MPHCKIRTNQIFLQMTAILRVLLTTAKLICTLRPYRVKGRLKGHELMHTLWGRFEEFEEFLLAYHLSEMATRIGQGLEILGLHMTSCWWTEQ